MDVNCFVIMPFEVVFNDVYKTIQDSVKAAVGTPDARCFRLDESQPAGRITDRLLQEISAADVCVADLTGNKPNVMWETGFAMALRKPVIIVTQELDGLPFDIRDMQALKYDRSNLSDTLGPQLKRMVIDTLPHIRAHPTNSAPSTDGVLIGELLEQMRDLRSVVSQVVKEWNPTSPQPNSDYRSNPDLAILEGAWRNQSTGSSLYAKIVDNDLLVPYCYHGNHELTGIYYGWRKTGEYWFARFCWLNGDVSGFAFLKQESIDTLTGSWWLTDDVDTIPNAPIQGSGVTTRWERKPFNFPKWANRFLKEVQEEGLASHLTRRGA